MRNLLADAEYVTANYPPASAQRWGADALGRAIGHEIAATGNDAPGLWAGLLTDIRLSGVFTVSQQIMVHQSMLAVLGA